jgi:hypothetical protein
MIMSKTHVLIYILLQIIYLTLHNWKVEIDKFKISKKYLFLLFYH